METLGHSQLATTADIDSHVLPALMADAAAKMGLALAGEYMRADHNFDRKRETP